MNKTPVFPLGPLPLLCGLVLPALLFQPGIVAADGPPEPALVLPLWPDAEVPPGDEGRAVARADGQPAPAAGDDSWKRVDEVVRPELWVYQPEEPSPGGAAVLVCPGGGYNRLAFEHEGTMVAEWLNRHGITALVLKYRLPRRSAEKPHEVPLRDARRAMGIARHHAADWGIRADRIGALGFSAGGDLVLRLGLAEGPRDHPEHEQFDAAPSRPDFLVVVYPAYQVDPASPTRLRADFEPGESLPPAFFAHAHDDPHPASASALLYLRWHAAEVPAELHVFSRGGHGFGMRAGNLPANQWPQRCIEWIDSMGWSAAP